MQNFIHTLEQGRLAGIIRVLVVTAVIVSVALIYLGGKFRGFSSAEAMDQAQIGSEIAAGHGWSTRFLRPLAIWQIEKNLGAPPKGDFPDTFNAPLPPLLDSLAIRLAGNHMDVQPRRVHRAGGTVHRGAVDAVLPGGGGDGVSSLAPGVRPAAGVLVGGADTGERPVLAVYPFGAAADVHAAALQRGALHRGAGHRGVPGGGTRRRDRQRGDRRGGPAGRHWESALLWLAATGAVFGLLALTHALTIWIFLGLLVFTAFYFRRRVPSVLTLLFAFGLVYTPWLVRTYRVCGNPFGLAGYSLFDGVGGSTAQRMRSVAGPLTDKRRALLSSAASSRRASCRRSVIWWPTWATT